MAAKKIGIIVGICVIIAGLGVGLFVMRHKDTAKPVANHVTTKSAAAKASSSNEVSVNNSSSPNSIQQATGNQSTPAAKNDTAAQVAKLTDPKTFSQYDAAKYKNATQAFYADLQIGTGAQLKAGQKAAVIYKGWLTNGQLFDETHTNSKGQQEAFQFTFDANPEQVIAGWDEGLSGMKVGGIRMLIIPPAVGYGASAQGSIPANSVLIFETQLVAVQ